VNDEVLLGAWTTLEPTSEQRRRIDTRVSEWLEAHDTPLVQEWLNLFKVAPLPAFGLAAASAVSMIFAPPLVWFTISLF
jgi:hypothetical protein